MTDSQQRADYYRKLFARLDKVEAQHLIDRLQVLALTRPDTVRELEAFLERDDPPKPQESDDTCRSVDVHARATSQ